MRNEQKAKYMTTNEQGISNKELLQVSFII